MIRAILAGLLLACGAACGERAPEPQTPQPALWAVESPRGETAGWLFGTIHALPDDTRWETPALTRAIAEAGVLVVEVRDLDPERTGAILRRLASDEPVPPLAERVPAASRQRLAGLLSEQRIAQDRFDTLETWAVALAVSRLAGTASAANGADKTLLRRFEGRRIAELEGAAAQLAIFDGLPERDQRKLLTAVLDEKSDAEADARALVAAWLAGDLTTLERTTRRGLLADLALYEALSARRNAAWVAKLVPMIERGERPLIAVGAAHVLGEEGLPALLAARGYRVRRVQ